MAKNSDQEVLSDGEVLSVLKYKGYTLFRAKSKTKEEFNKVEKEINKIREALNVNKREPQSEETKKKISASMKKVWAKRKMKKR